MAVFGLGQWRSIAQAVLLAILACLPLCGHAAEFGFAPVSGQMTSPFGWRVDPMTGSQRFHGGIDLAASSGVPVYAPQAGYVLFSGYYGGYGNVVVLNHGHSLYTLYGHNSQLLVNAGEAVYRGQAISRVGSTGRSTGPHLHFEVHYNGQYINPITYLSYLQPLAGQTLAQATPQTISIQPAHQAQTAQVERHGAQLHSAHRARTVRRNGRHAAQGTQVVEVLTGSNVENIEF